MAEGEQPVKAVKLKELLGEAEAYKEKGYRLVHICCTKLAENSFELTYAFDKDYKLENLRITAARETEIPSVTRIFPGAFLYENEIMEFFGVAIKGVSVDFKGHLYKKKVEHPFAVDTDKVDESCKKG